VSSSAQSIAGMAAPQHRPRGQTSQSAYPSGLKAETKMRYGRPALLARDAQAFLFHALEKRSPVQLVRGRELANASSSILIRVSRS